MAKFASNDVLDAALAVVASADRLVVVAGQPTDYAAASNGALAQASVSAADFSIGSGSGGGRRLQVAPRSGIIAQAAGTADHVALLDSVRQRLIYVTTCPPRSLAVGSPLQVAGWQVDVGAPL